MSRSWLPTLAALLAFAAPSHAHLTGDANHDALVRRFAREFSAFPLAQIAPAAGATPETTPAAVATFARFGSAVRVRWDERYVWVESNGLPAHPTMIGITAWQQQVPLPQPYTGNNAWRIPRQPIVAEKSVSIRGRFLRGAIAVAANGIPIFNPQNNRGEISADIGELDERGGHCGRADDYHYHVAPLHLQATLGAKLPIAYALDGYAIYGLTEPDGSAPRNLDECNGHETTSLGYHYHASKKYPFVQGGFHGVVVERDDQVDPQPRAQPIRPALPPLRGARITEFTVTPDQMSFELRYNVDGRVATVNYANEGRGWRFRFVEADGTTREEVFPIRRGSP